MTDYSDLTTAVTDQLTRDDLTTPQVDRFIKLAEARFNRDMMVPAREATTTLTVGTTGRATLPADYVAMRAVYVAAQADPTLTQMSLVELVRSYLGTGAVTGNLRHYAISGTEIVVGPTPSANVTVSIVYYKTIPALTSGASSNWLSTAHFDLYYCGVLTEAYLTWKNFKEAPIWDERTVAKMTEVEKAGVRKMVGAAPLAPRGTYRSIPGVRA